MNSPQPEYTLAREASGTSTLSFSGNWAQGHSTASFSGLQSELQSSRPERLTIDGTSLGAWDSIFMAFLLRCHDYCHTEGIALENRNMPAGVVKLLAVATAVQPFQPGSDNQHSWLSNINLGQLLGKVTRNMRESLSFTGEVTIALSRLIRGKANTRFTDFWSFCWQAGPNAFAIITLTSILVGMILGYLGAVQLKQFGAEIYVANLVVIGMLREMGVLMTAVVMAGRTGAAYAAQLGTMQTNEEIDAITTMGISPIEFLVLPRMLALIVIMPLLTIYADLLGIVGGGIVAGGLGVSPIQYMVQGESALSFTQISVGLIKALVFAVLIAVAGCRAGINSGRSSAAVGRAATNAVVTAIVYLIVADAAINIIFQHLGI
ncbi:MAG: ABC transporter permease [Halioglobus sp.]|nr:ABC transporter permease [Halioglobus sp.]